MHRDMPTPYHRGLMSSDVACMIVLLDLTLHLESDLKSKLESKLNHRQHTIDAYSYSSYMIHEISTAPC